MPINPNIALQVQPAKINTPFENLDVVMQARQRQAVVQDAERKARAAQQAEQEAAAVRGILEQTGGDWDQALPQIRRVAPGASLEIEKQLGEARTKAIDAATKTLALERDLTSKYVRRLQAVPDGDDELYQFVRGQMARELPDEAAMLPETYDKTALQRFSLIGLDADKVYARDQDALKLVLEGKWREAAGTSLSVATDAEDWNERIQGLRGLGMPASEIAQFGSYSPENVQRAAVLSMTPEKRATLAGQAEGRAITVRGQDLSAETARRGQDLSAAAAAAGRAVTRRGQDLTNARAKEAAAAGGTGGAKLSAAAVEKIASVDQSLGMLDDIERLLPAMGGAVGPIDGRVAKAKISAGVGVSPELAEFDAQLTGLKNAVIKATTGAAMSEQEAKRIMGQLPDLSQPESIFQARLKTTRKNLDLLKKRTIELSGGVAPESGDAAPGGAGALNQTPIGGRSGVEVVVNGRAFVFPTQAAADAFKAKAGVR